MSDAEAKQVLDQLYSNALDVAVIAGVGYIEGRKVAMGRIVDTEEHPARPWPKTLEVRRAQVAGGVDLLVIYPPEQFDLPWLAVEWTDSSAEFCETAARTGMFVLEFYSPLKLRRALVVGGQVEGLPDQPMDAQLFKDIVAGHYDSSGTPKINARPNTVPS